MGPQPRRFHYSLDWRFLLPLTDTKKIYLLLEEDKDFSQVLEQVGINSSQQLSFSDFQQHRNADIHSVVIPFGIPASWVSGKLEDQVEFYASIRRFLSPGGCLLVGFNNRWNWRAKSQKQYYLSTPRHVIQQLKQAGFQSVSMFGAMPSLAIPEYIFDLDSRTIQYSLQNRFRRKPAVLRALRILSATMGWKRISNFLPCFFAGANA